MKTMKDEWLTRRMKDFFQFTVRTGFKLMPEPHSKPRSSVSMVLSSSIEKSLQKLENDPKEVEDFKTMLKMAKKMLFVVDHDSYYHTAVRELLEDIYGEMKNLKERNKW